MLAGHAILSIFILNAMRKNDAGYEEEEIPRIADNAGIREEQRFLSCVRKEAEDREEKTAPESPVDERYRELVKIPPDGILR